MPACKLKWSAVGAEATQPKRHSPGNSKQERHVCP